MQTIAFEDLASYLISGMGNGGALLTTAKDAETNTMTIGWATCGTMFGKKVVMVMVRHSRYTYELLKTNKEVTISIPLDDSSKPALSICGSRSGRDVDKLNIASLQTQPAKVVSTPIITLNNAMYVEGKVILEQDMDLEALDADLKDKWYPTADNHKLFFLEILACYK